MKDETQTVAQIAVRASAIAMQTAVIVARSCKLHDTERSDISANLQYIAHLLEELGTDEQAAIYHLAARAVRENKGADSQD
jgi:hypothetical protein